MNMYAVELQNLQPETVYYYRCGNPSVNAWSSQYFFTTPPSTTPDVVQWLIFGDMGTTIPMGKTVTDSILRGLLV